MTKVDLKVGNQAPAAAPANVALTAFGDGETVELRVKVSDKVGVRAYGFAFDGVPVVMQSGRGRFFAPKREAKLLEWVMIGDPGGAMRVSVTRDGTAVQEREASTIAPPFAKGYDAFEILEA